MSAIRMIKLFGWEHRIADQMNARRERELAAVYRTRLLGVASYSFKCVLFPKVWSSADPPMIQLDYTDACATFDVLHIRT